MESLGSSVGPDVRGALVCHLLDLDADVADVAPRAKCESAVLALLVCVDSLGHGHSPLRRQSGYWDVSSAVSSILFYRHTRLARLFSTRGA